MSDIGFPDLTAFSFGFLALASLIVALIALNLLYCGRKTWGDFAAGRRASGLAGALSMTGSAAVLVVVGFLGLLVS